MDRLVLHCAMKALGLWCADRAWARTGRRPGLALLGHAFTEEGKGFDMGHQSPPRGLAPLAPAAKGREQK